MTKKHIPVSAYETSEIRKNQDWYLWTALAVSCVIFWQIIFIPLKAGWVQDISQKKEKKYKREVYKVYQLKSLRKKYVDDFGYPYSFPEPAPCKDFYAEKPIPPKYAPKPVSDYADIHPKPLNLWCVWDAIGCPKYMEEEGRGGTVKATIWIDKKGHYMYHSINKTAYPKLVERVENYISLIKFSPAIQNGQAIEYWMDVSFPFYEEYEEPKEINYPLFRCGTM